MRLPAILLASTAVTAQLSSIESGSSIDEIQEENFEIEETEFEWVTILAVKIIEYPKNGFLEIWEYGIIHWRGS